MFCYQENTHFSQALPCTKEVFWEQVRKSSTAWRVDARRAILAAVEASKTQGAAALEVWLHNSDYQKFLLKKQGLKKESARQAWEAKSDAEKLLAFAKEVKENSVAFIFSCYEFDATETGKGNLFRHRRLKDCHLNGLVMLDIDHVENPMQIWYKLRDNEKLMSRTKFVSLTSSGYGIRIVFTADISLGNLADNQIVFAQELGGYQPDESCIDGTRNSWAPKEEDIFFIDDSIFDYYDEDFDKRFTPEYREKRTQPLYHVFPSGSKEGIDSKERNLNSKEYRNIGEANESICSKEIRREGDSSQGDDKKIPKFQDSLDNKNSLEQNNSIETKWRGYDIQAIIDQRYGDRLPCAADSNRHNESLKLATDLLLMLDGDKARVQRIVEAQPWVQEIIAERDENVGQTVSSAADCVAQKEKKYAASLPSKAMQEAIKAHTGMTFWEVLKGQPQAAVAEQEMDPWLWMWGEEIEKLAADYPIFKDITKGLKRNQYPAALFVAGGLFMTLMTRCTYRFYHRPEELRRLNNSTLIIGDPASGKSFATRLFKLLAAPIIAADKVGMDAINAYRELMRTKGANKEKPKKPKVVIRVHPARTSNAQFIQDMVNAVEEVNGEPMQLHMLTFDTELDNTLTVQKGGAWIDKMSLELKAFHNEEDGQAYSNMDSILQNFYVYWNFIYTGTPNALKKKITEQNFGSGLATRLTCVPLPATNFEMMSRESYVDMESDNRLKGWATLLDKTKGELSVQKIVDELYDWTARRMEDAKENNSRADEMLLKRCAYHGLNFSAPFIVMRHWDQMRQDGEYWCGEFETDDVDWKLAELIVNIQYACQRHFFGAMAENYFDNKNREASANVRHSPKTIEAFNRLPEEFTKDDVKRCFDLKSESAITMRICRLLKDCVVAKYGTFVENGTTKARYKKTGVVLLS